MPQSSGNTRRRQRASPSSRDPDAVAARVVLDEDLPAPLAEHLRARGVECEHVVQVRERLGIQRGAKFSDADVVAEVARVPSVLVTLNVRDYADHAFIQTLAEDHGISVVIVRPPNAEARRGQRGPAIHDIVHRWAHRIRRLHEGDPVIVSAIAEAFVLDH
jgi:hypothetical protein